MDQPKKRRTIQSDRTPGVLFTVSVPSHMKQSTNAILSLFDAATARSSDADRASVTPLESTVSDAISVELAQLSTKRRAGYRFSAELSRGIGLIAFSGNHSPSDFVHEVLKAELPRVAPMYVSRLIPMDFTCAPNIVSFEAVMIPQIQAYFREGADQTWKIVFEKHGLTNITKDKIIELTQAVIPDRHEISIQKQDIVVMIQTTQSLCGLSFLKDYECLCEYNIRKLIASRNEADQDSFTSS